MSKIWFCNSNILFGPVVSDDSYYKLDFTGDSNKIDWNIGYIGSTDDSNINFDVTGSSNQFDLDQGYALSAERLNADLILIGSSNIFDVDWESDDLTWDFEITGDSNNIGVAKTIAFLLMYSWLNISVFNINSLLSTRLTLL